MEFAHRSVLLHECIDALAIKPDGIYLDGTLGGAGHSLEICRSLTTGRLIGVDRDLVALEAAKKRLYRHAKKVTLVHDNFENVGAILTALGLDRIDGMLFDLGVSSPQLDDAERGFSYMADAPLDMRMDRDQSLTAYEIVNNWPREELKSILYEYGEERCAPQIAAAIERVRTDHPIETTLELVDIIRSAMPPSALREKQHPAKRSFQAIRIAVNDELGAVRQGMEAAIDRDLVALEAAKKRLYRHAKKVTLVHDNFENVGAILTALGLDRIDGMLFDLGVSSPQLDDAERGFSYMADAPLDMRMDRDQSLTAYEIVNNWPREELKSILYEYGEERCAPQIAAAIERVRTDHPIETTLELVDIIRSAMPPSALREKQHPAKRSFQAIRIAVNDELGAVRQGMEAAIDHLNPGGRLVVITFHSLEDRIVKNVFQDAAKGCTCPPSFPVCVCGHKPKIKILTKKPIIATREEVEENPRSRSAKLRVAEHV